MTWHPRSVVAKKNNDSIVGQPRLLKLFDLLANPLIHLGNVIVILGQVLTHFGSVRPVLGQLNRLRIRHCLMGSIAYFAFMGSRVVNHREEGIPGFLSVARTVTERGFLVRLVPDFTRFWMVVVFLFLVGT